MSSAFDPFAPRPLNLCPHPIRTRRIVCAHAGTSWEDILAASPIVAALVDAPPNADNVALRKHLIAALPDAPMATHAASSVAGVMRLAALIEETVWHHSGGIVMETDADLLDQLLDSDISADVPARWLRLPHERPLYLHCPTDRIAVRSSEQDTLPLGGFFVREAMPCSEHYRSRGATRVLEVMAMSQPPHGSTSLDQSNFTFFSIPIHDEDTGLASLFAATVRGADIPYLGDDYLDYATELLGVAARILLYTNLRECRMQLHRPYSEAMAAAARLGNRKRDKALRRARNLYDWIQISTPIHAGADTEGTTDTMQHVRPHVRRGHFRNQHFGPGNRNTKLVWIRPTLVGKHHIAAPRHYRLR